MPTPVCGWQHHFLSHSIGETSQCPTWWKEQPCTVWTDIHKHSQRKGLPLPWPELILQMGPRGRGVEQESTVTFLKLRWHWQLIGSVRGQAATVPPMSQWCMLGCVYMQTTHLLSSLPSLASLPRNLLKISFTVLGHCSPDSLMALSCWLPYCKLLFCQIHAAHIVFLWSKPRKEPGGYFTFYLMNSTGIKQTYLIFPCVCTFSSVFVAYLVLLFWFMLHFTPHQFSLLYYMYKIPPNIHLRK